MDTILSHIRTQEEAQELLHSLSSFESQIYSLKKSGLQDYFSHLPKNISEAMQMTFQGDVTEENMQKLHNDVKQLQDKIDHAKIVQLTLAFEVDEDAINLFSSWTKANIGPDALIAIQLDRTMVGGAIIVAGGQYRDYSVRKKLSQVFQIQKEDILGSVSQNPESRV